jgi:Zn-dependent peptidase ImmA (M78 family)
VLVMVGRRPDAWTVVVSETLHLTPDGTETAHGLWEPAQRRIVINRRCLRSSELFVGTLLHEIGHAVTGATDLTADFEDGLTDLLGTVGTRAVGGG